MDDVNGELEVESMAKRTIDSLKGKKQELGVKRNMLANVLKNDAEYRKLDEEFLRIKKARLARKSELMHQEENEKMQASVNDLTREVKDEQAALSDYLRQYRDNTKSDMIELDDGTMFLIRANFKVKKESKADRWLRNHRDEKKKESVA